MEFWRLPKVRWTALLGGALLLRLLFFVGPQASDDGAYSDYAHAILRGSFHLAPDIFSTRLGYLTSIAGVYAIFGAGPFTLVLTNLIFSLGGLILAYWTAREFVDEAGAWRTTLLLALFPLDVFFATEAHTDLPLAVLFTGAVLLFLRARKREGIVLFILSGMTLGIAHLFKESAFFGLAALLVLSGRPKPREAWVLAGFFAVVALEAAGYAAATGDALYRVHAARAAQAQDIAVLHAPGVSSAGLVLDALTQFFNPASVGFPFYGLLPGLALAASVIALRVKDTAVRPAILWMTALVLLLIFWPISLSPFRPALRSHARIFLMAEVPMAILGAWLLGRLSSMRAGLLFGSIALASIVCLTVIHSDARRLTEGARLAFDGPLHSESGAVSDPRTTYLFRLYDGYAPTRTWSDWNAPNVLHCRVVNETWTRTLRDWYGIEAPAGFEPAGVAPDKVLKISGRLRLRPLLKGRVERLPPDEVRIYSAPKAR